MRGLGEAAGPGELAGDTPGASGLDGASLTCGPSASEDVTRDHACLTPAACGPRGREVAGGGGGGGGSWYPLESYYGLRGWKPTYGLGTPLCLLHSPCRRSLQTQGYLNSRPGVSRSPHPASFPPSFRRSRDPRGNPAPCSLPPSPANS